MGKEQFPVLKNLAFYPGFTTSLVYFISLEKYEGITVEYQKERQRIVNEANSASPTFSSKEEKDNSLFVNAKAKYIQCYEYIAKAVEYEAKNEAIYFQDRLKELKSTFSKEDQQKVPQLKALIDMFSNSITNTDGTITIDYKYFLTLVNGLMQGFDTTKTVALHEQKRINAINDALTEMQKRKRKQLEGLADKKKLPSQEAINFIEHSMDKYSSRIDEYYIEHKNYKTQRNEYGKVTDTLRGATTAFKKIPKTVAVTLSDWMNRQIKNIFSNKEIVDSIVEYAKIVGLVNPDYKQELSRKVQGIIVQALVDQGIQHTEEILDSQYRNIPKQKIIQELEKSIRITQQYKITGFHSGLGLRGLNLDAFKDIDKDFDLHDRSAKQFMEAFDRLRKKIGKAKKNHYGLKESQQSLYDLMQKEEIYKKYEDMDMLINRLRKILDEMNRIQKSIDRKVGQATETITKQAYGGKAIGHDSNNQPLYLNFTITPTEVTIDNLNATIQNTQEYKNLFGESRNLNSKNLRSLLATLTSNSSKQLKEELANIVDKAVQEATEENKTEMKTEMEKIIYEGLTDLDIRVTGPDIGELISAINFVSDKSKITINWSGAQKAKNDVITISVHNANIHFKTSLDLLISRQNQRITDLIEQRIDPDRIGEQLSVNIISEFQKSTSSAFAHSATAQANRYSYNAKIFFDKYRKLLMDQTALDDDFKTLHQDINDYQKYLQSEGNIPAEIDKKMKQIIQALKDSFYISTTVKEYDQYNNKIGFHGGSIGGTLSAQLGHINNIFTLAGMPISQADMEWLTHCIINCGTNMLDGRKNAPLIESYIGSMAAFMLFDEGGAETMIINDLLNKSKIQATHASPKILHLYQVNGIYVPGSYVLAQIRDNLSQCISFIDQIAEPDYKGAGVRIVNKMNESMIPNRTAAGITDTKPWETIASKANSNVSIEIFFLANLLDIVNQINKVMSGIQFFN